MVLVSIHPFAVRKILLLVIGVLGLSSALCFADPLFMARQYAAVGNQTRQVGPVTPQATFDRSVIWLSFENSPERSGAIRTIGFLSPLSDETREMRPITSTSIVAGFQRVAVSGGCPEAGLNSPPSLFQGMSASGL